MSEKAAPGADVPRNAHAFSRLRPEGPVVNSPERQLGVGVEGYMRPEGPAQSRSAAPSVLIVRSILSRPDGRAYLLSVLRT
jgi:hypothetical protein